MEVSVIGSSSLSSSQSIICSRGELLYRDLGVFVGRNENSRILCPKPSSWQRLRKSSGLLRLSMNAVKSTEPVQSSRLKPKTADEVRLFVGLPSDGVSDCNTINHAKAITAGLKALKLLGVEGVELPIWWGRVEKQTRGEYTWSAYLILADMIHNAGLKLHVSLCFHASNDQNIPLPKWVSRVGEHQPGFYFTDRSRQRYKECLSLSVDSLHILDGKTPIEVYRDFCDSFKSTFSKFMGSTITGISVGLGPEGELRYPSQRQHTESKTGVGEFQCYDPIMLGHLKQNAESVGNPLWGLDGPHDTPKYHELPNSNSFFQESWDSPYGEFFLSWYSSQLVAHGDRLLSMASSIFKDTSVTIYGKIPLMHSWYKTCSHPCELTAGFYNTCNRNGYEAVAQIFAKNSCEVILPGFDLSDKYQPIDSHSSPELLLAQIRNTCENHWVQVSGQNSSDFGTPGGFMRMKKNLLSNNVVKKIFYQRMGAYFFSPEHFPSFRQLVRSLSQPELHSDDLLSNEEGLIAEPLSMSSESSVPVAAA